MSCRQISQRLDPAGHWCWVFDLPDWVRMTDWNELTTRPSPWDPVLGLSAAVAMDVRALANILLQLQQLTGAAAPQGVLHLAVFHSGLQRHFGWTHGHRFLGKL